MKIRLLTQDDKKEIKNLYKSIIENTYTLWNENYPNDELIDWDIERNGLYGVFENDTLIAVSFIGERCEDGEDDFSWKNSFKKRGTFARIGVSPSYQNKGVGTYFVKFILRELKLQGFDGVRILVGTQNINAIKLYSKFGFENCGRTKRFGRDYYLFELNLS